MRYLLILCLILINSASVLAQDAEFSFIDRILKLDEVAEGTPVEFKYEFTNSGGLPLIISEYDVECTCTKVTFPTEPVKPGEKGEIKVLFETDGKVGWQYRKIYLLTNTKDQIEELEFRIKILPLNH